MANIQLKIRTLADNDTEINSIKNTGNNVTNGSVKLANSEGVFATIPTADFAGQELLTFAGGALQFTSNGILANGSGNVGKLVDEGDGKEFIWGVVPESKEYFVEVQLSVSDLDLTAITLYGDSVAQQYPTEVIVNGQTYQNDDVVLTIPVNTNSTQINVKMTKWKRANYNACLTKIAIFAGEIQLENRDIKSLESLSQSTGQPESIFYGCVPSSGSASINDRKGEFYDYIKNGVISNSNSAIDLFVNGKKVQTHIATDSDYDLGGRVFSLDLENKLSLYDNIMYEGYPYTGNSQSLYDIFEGFATSVGFADQIEKMLSTEIEYTVDGENYVGKVADYFDAIIIPYPYIERGTVRETLDKFCTLAQLNLIEDDNGDLIFVQARPIRTGSERVLVIPAKNQMSSIDRNIIVKNNVSKANVVYKKVSKTDAEQTVLVTKILETPVVVNFKPNPDVVYGSLKYIDGNDLYGYLGMCIQLNQFDTGYHIGKVVILKNEVTKNVTNVSEDIVWTVTGKKKYGNVKTHLSLRTTDGNWVRPVATAPAFFTFYGNTINDIADDVNYKYITNFSTKYQASKIEPSVISRTYTQYYEMGGMDREQELSHTITTDIQPYVYIKETGESYIVEYRVPVERTTTMLRSNYYNNSVMSQSLSGIFVQDYLESGNWWGYEKIIAERLELSIYGTSVSISLEDANLVDIANETNTVTISGNEMLQEYSQVSGGKSLARVISNNIVTDYANGVSTCRVTVICGDYKDEAGVVRKNWAKGEILQVGDIVRLDKDNDGTPAVTYKDGSPMLWKITGRNLRHNGVPLLDLELQEIF